VRLGLADLLTPLYEDLKTVVLASKVIHTDDTVVPVNDRDRTETRAGRLWVCMSGGHPADLVFHYGAIAPGRGRRRSSATSAATCRLMPTRATTPLGSVALCQGGSEAARIRPEEPSVLS
jgi:hypothetical protein